jgi:hypothetical protein
MAAVQNGNKGRSRDGDSYRSATAPCVLQVTFRRKRRSDQM